MNYQSLYWRTLYCNQIINIEFAIYLFDVVDRLCVAAVRAQRMKRLSGIRAQHHLRLQKVENKWIIKWFEINNVLHFWKILSYANLLCLMQKILSHTLVKVVYGGAFRYYLLVWDRVDTLHNNNMYAEGKWGRISRAV